MYVWVSVVHEVYIEFFIEYIEFYVGRGNGYILNGERTKYLWKREFYSD